MNEETKTENESSSTATTNLYTASELLQQPPLANNTPDVVESFVPTNSSSLVKNMEDRKPSPVEATVATTDQSTADESLEFVNRGLEQWEKAREKWLERANDKEEMHAIAVDVDEIIEVIFANPREYRSNSGRPFPHNVPLPQMVDILQDLWEAEGLDT